MKAALTRDQLPVGAAFAVSCPCQVRTNRSDIVENDLYVPHDLEGTWLHPEYERAVLRAYRVDDVTSARALSLLRQNFSEDDLPGRATVDEGSLWALTE